MSADLTRLAELDWRPLFAYEDCGTPIEFELETPQRQWVPRSVGVGGHDVATSGVDESFVIRHDRVLKLTLRLTEQEWIDYVEPMIACLWRQAQVFTVQLDANDEATAYEVRLVSPWMTDGAEPRFHEFDGMYEFELTVRTDDGSAFERYHLSLT